MTRSVFETNKDIMAFYRTSIYNNRGVSEFLNGATAFQNRASKFLKLCMIKKFQEFKVTSLDANDSEKPFRSFPSILIGQTSDSWQKKVGKTSTTISLSISKAMPPTTFLLMRSRT